MKQHINPCLPGLLLIFLMCLSGAGQAQTFTPKYVSMSTNTKAYYEYLPEGYNPTGTTTYSLILFMTGIGEFGDGTTSTTYGLPKVLKHGIPKLINEGVFPKSFTAGGATHRFIVITPQWSAKIKPTPADMNAVLDYIVSHYKVNLKRIYLTGLSYGGGLCFAFVGNNSTYANRIAAIVPIAAPLPEGGYATIYSRSRVIAAGNIPVWATHNSGDTPDSASRTIAYINYINQAPAPNPLARKTIFTAGGHDAWTKTYNFDFRENGYNIYEWMLLHQKGSAPPAPNAAPISKAGSDKIITLPTSSVTLSGSGTDSDGTITYKWTKYSGPVEGTITSSTAASTSVTGLVRGIYIFRLTVIDNKSAKGVDDVKVTVNPAAGTKAIQVNIYGGSNSYSNTTWNNWNVGTTAATNKTSTAFKYVDGATSAVTAVLSATSTMGDNSSTYGTGVAMAPGAVLRYASTHTASRTLTINGLSTTKSYNLDFYASRNSSSAGNTIFVIGSTTKTIAAYNNYTGKAAFTSVKPSSTGQIVVTINKSATYSYLNGFTITENSATTAAAIANTITAADVSEKAAVQTIGISAYPNPTLDNVQLTLNNSYTGLVQAQLVDESGKNRQNIRLVKNNALLQQNISLAGLPKGVYYLSIQMGNTRETKKIIKL